MKSTSAASFERHLQQACQLRDPSALIRLMIKDAVWRDNDAVHVGREEIWSALSNKWASALHCTLNREVVSCDEMSVVIRFDSEWQHSVRGRWYRTSGRVRASFNDHGHVTKVESQLTVKPISVSDRRLAIPVGATRSQNSANEILRGKDQ